jgi:predicted RNase H-like HicB family nuclease
MKPVNNYSNKNREYVMQIRYILSEYVEKAMEKAVYDKLENGKYFGKIKPCKGVIAFGNSLSECERELQSVLEDWILVGLKLKHILPIIDNIDLNKEPAHEKMGTVQTA